MEKVLLALWFASMEYGVSYELLYALAKVESGLYPYAVNVEGRSYYPKSVKEALGLIRGKKNYDLGLMQINAYWVRKFNLKPEWLLDVEYNAKMGAAILSYCMGLFGNTWRAVECYHRGEGRAGNYGTYSARVCGVIYGKEMCFTF